MSSDVAIRVDGVAKAFAIYDKPHHRLLQQLFPNARSWHREFHALRDLSFEVKRGEAVGIVGRNGSGKSTLLQIICGTLTPTRGKVEVNGRIAALLELGAGFNPEFTGRENVYLNGTVLGLTRAQVDARFADITAFADIGEFIDQPVKTYSSGMYVRLAFAVAINVDPDILVVDEALSVGDEAFQRKCFARIQALRDKGVTILFVSHSAGIVLELCNRALLLDRGEMLKEGTPKFVLSRYQKLAYAPAAQADGIRAAIRAESEDTTTPVDTTSAEVTPAAASVDVAEHAQYDASLVPLSQVRYVNRGAQIEDPHLETTSGRRVNLLVAGGEYVYTYVVRFERTASGVRAGMLIRSISGLELAGAVTATPLHALPLVAAGEELRVRFRWRCLLAPGAYFLNAGVLGRVEAEEEYLDRNIDAAMFRVLPDNERLATAFVDLHVRSEITSTAKVVE